MGGINVRAGTVSTRRSARPLLIDFINSSSIRPMSRSKFNPKIAATAIVSSGARSTGQPVQGSSVRKVYPGVAGCKPIKSPP
jgi:hypothetical protein